MSDPIETRVAPLAENIRYAALEEAEVTVEGVDWAGLFGRNADRQLVVDALKGDLFISPKEGRKIAASVDPAMQKVAEALVRDLQEFSPRDTRSAYLEKRAEKPTCRFGFLSLFGYCLSASEREEIRSELSKLDQKK